MTNWIPALTKCNICGELAICNKNKIIMEKNVALPNDKKVLFYDEKNIISCCTYCRVGLRTIRKSTWKKLKKIMRKKYENYDAYFELILFLSLGKYATNESKKNAIEIKGF